MNLKRIQARAFQEDIKDANTQVAQIDYVMAYQCQQQSEVIVNKEEKLHYGQEEVRIYLLVLCNTTIKPKHSSSVQTIKENKFFNGTFLEYLYENELSMMTK